MVDMQAAFDRMPAGLCATALIAGEIFHLRIPQFCQSSARAQEDRKRGQIIGVDVEGALTLAEGTEI